MHITHQQHPAAQSPNGKRGPAPAPPGLTSKQCAFRRAGEVVNPTTAGGRGATPLLPGFGASRVAGKRVASPGAPEQLRAGLITSLQVTTCPLVVAPIKHFVYTSHRTL
jgi:hypothetical protein